MIGKFFKTKDKKTMKDKDYIKSKLDHLKALGITADIDPVTGGVRPDWIKHEQEEREKRTAAREMAKQRQKEYTSE